MRTVNVIIMAAVMATLASCEKNYHQDDFPANLFDSTEAGSSVRIFIKNAGGNDGEAKSGAAGSQEVLNGDTVQMPRGMNILMYAEDLYGAAIKGQWAIAQKKSDNPDGYETTAGMGWYSGDQIAHRFEEFGVYKVSFGNFVNWGQTDTLISFYVRINGTPGKVGDDWNGQYIFRMEKKQIWKNGLPERAFFLYFKYNAQIADDEAYLNLISFVNQAGFTGVYLERKEMARWPFSGENYFYYVLLEDEIDESAVYYKAQFMVKNESTNSSNPYSYSMDANNYVSGWTNNQDGIEFAIL